MGRVLKSHAAIAAVAFIVGVSVAGGVAWAAIPDNTIGTITACYPTSGTTKGALRVIDYQGGARCNTGEALLSWPSRSFRWRGAWNSTTAYTVNDVVRYNGSAYIAYNANTNVVPTNTSYWNLMVAAGVSAPGVTISTAPAEVSVAVSGSETCTCDVDLGGPSTTITVPASGFVDLYIRIDIRVTPMVGGSADTYHSGIARIFVDGATTGRAVTAAATSDQYQHYWINSAFEATPGSHTFSLRYSAENSTVNAWTGTAYFKNRILEVKPVS